MLRNREKDAGCLAGREHGHVVITLVTRVNRARIRDLHMAVQPRRIRKLEDVLDVRLLYICPISVKQRRLAGPF